jgi:hypothetical protein
MESGPDLVEGEARSNPAAWKEGGDTFERWKAWVKLEDCGNSGCGANLIRQTRAQVLDQAHRGDFVGIDFHMKLVLEMQNHRDQIERIERQLFVQKGIRIDRGRARPRGDASNRVSDGGKDFRMRATGVVGRRVHGTPRFERGSEIEQPDSDVDTPSIAVDAREPSDAKNGSVLDQPPNRDQVRLQVVSRDYHRTKSRAS